jgi:hypothetical protein
VFRAGRTASPHSAHTVLRPHIASPLSVFALCLSKHARLLKVFLHSPHVILVPEKEHEGTDMQSLHVCRHLFVYPNLQPLPHPLHTWRFAIAQSVSLSCDNAA